MNMRETAEFVGGSLTISSSAGAGSLVRMDIASLRKEGAV
jgi:signal transduction histidine kinase